MEGFSKVTVRYDDSLPNLIRAARAAGLDLASADTIVVRDTAGRLAIAFRKRLSKSNFSADLKVALDRYALLPEPILSPLFFNALDEAGPILLTVPVDQEYADVRFLDRRVVGMDWLAEFAPPASGPPRLVFGSLKGGVGRSTALAVLASDLAHRGKRVLCIDLDLEAPGIGSMLLHESLDDDRRPRFGVIDYLVENGLGGTADEELFDHIGISQFGGGGVHVLPAVGRVTDANPANMIGKLAHALTEDVTAAGRRPLSVQIREMVDRFVGRFPYDAVLIDSRAGLAETTASTWLGVGASKLVLFGIDQPQTFHGYRYVFTHLVQTLRVAAVPDQDDWRSRISFVHAKASPSGGARTVFRENLHRLCADVLYDEDEGPEAESGFNFAFGETGPDIPHDASVIESHPAYDAFDPIADGCTLVDSGYRGPFSSFLTRTWDLLGMDRSQ